MSIEPPEIIKTSERTVSCDGGEGPLGHPRVYLNMRDDDTVECPYCDRLFILEGGKSDEDAKTARAG